LTTPLSRAWSTLIRYPLLALIPVLWEAGVFLLNLSLGSLPQRGPGNTFSLKLLLPQSLPSGAELISQSVTLNVQSFVGEPVVPMLIGTILGAMVTAGYLHLLNRALLGAAPSWRAFAEGAARFGPRLLLWNLLSLVILFIVFILSAAVPILPMMIMMLLALLYFPAPFVVVVNGLSIPETVTTTPSILRAHLRDLIPVCVAALVMSAICSLGLTAAGLGLLLLASPLWGWFGTWVSLGVLAALQPQDLTA
jgi:hypothetical protein